jgi:filamentous hemagglutinin family protein
MLFPFKSCFLFSLSLLFLNSTSVARSQIIPDATLPVNSKVNTIEDISIISNGTRTGNNLFHSFEEFSIVTNGEAFFINTIDINNIFVRVTGGNASNIDGSLRTDGIADLFLLNPNGIIFGQNAQLNLNGSFVASTANSIVFADGTEFSGAEPQTEPLLTITSPIGLQYGENAGSIVYQSQNPGLQVSSENTLALVGGHVILNGGSVDESGGNYLGGGRVELGGLVGSGTVALKINKDNNLTLNFPDSVARGNVSITNFNFGFGDVVIHANNLDVAKSTLPQMEQINVQNTITVSQSSEITGKENSNITATSVLLDNDSQISADRLFIQDDIQNSDPPFVLEDVEITAGDRVEINRQTVLLENSSINSSSGTMTADTIYLKENSSLSIDNIIAENISMAENSGLFSESITGGTISLENSSTITSDNITADTISLKESSDLISDNVTADTISLQNSSLENQINGSGTLVADTVVLEAESKMSRNDVTTRALTLTGASRLRANIINAGESISVANSLVETLDKNLNINAQSLFLSDGAEIKVENLEFGVGNINIDVRETINLSDSGIRIFIDFGEVIPENGDIDIKAESLLLSNGSFITTLIPNPPQEVTSAGNININVRDQVSLDNSLISSSVFGTTGQIFIQADSVSLANGAQVRSDIFSQLSSAGNIKINAEDSVNITGTHKEGYSSGIFSGIESNEGQGGNIIIDTPLLRVSDGAVLNAQTQSGGRGGDIQIWADIFEAVNGGQLVTTTFGSGQAGNILLNIDDRATIEGQDPTYDTRIEQLNQPNISIAPVKPEIPIESDSFGLLSNTGAGVSRFSGLFANTDVNLNSMDNQNTTIGNAGNIQVWADSLNLDRGALLSTETTTGEGGDINLQVGSLQLRNNSGISTTAGRAGAGGDGGNITIGARTIAGLENSDIAANAFEGSGGQIRIDANAIFGLQDLSRQELQNRLGTDDLTQFENPNQLLESSDIVAISQTNPTLSGEIVFNIQNPNPTSGLLELATNIVDVNALLNRDPCVQGVDSEFVVTGSGGLPSGVRESLSADAIWGDTRSPMRQADELQQPVATVASSTSTERIVEATGWEFGPDGQIILVAEQSNASVYRWGTSPTCEEINNR